MNKRTHPNSTRDEQDSRFRLEPIVSAIGLNRENSVSWSIKVLLGFLLVCIPAHQLALHFFYSPKGALVSGGLALTMAALLNWGIRRRQNRWSDLSMVLIPFAMTLTLYLVMPTQLNLLFSLIVSTLFSAHVLPSSSEKLVVAGRRELICKLRPFSFAPAAKPLRVLFLAWTASTFVSHVVFRVSQSSLAAFIPYIAIAVSCMAVQNSKTVEEPQ